MKIKQGNNKTAKLLLSLCLAGLMSGLASVAKTDDIDAYRAPPKQKVAHNMLFIVDESGSMWGRVDGTPKVTILKTALKRLLALPGMKGNKVAIMGYNSASHPTNTHIPRFNPISDFTTLTSASVTTLQNSVDNLSATGGTPSGPAIYYGLRWLTSGWNSNPNSRTGNMPLWTLSNNATSGNLQSPLNSANHCADNRLIFLSDGEPNVGIRSGDRVTLSTSPTVSTSNLNLLRAREDVYINQIYRPVFPVANAFFSNSYGTNWSNLIGSGTEGTNNTVYRAFLLETDTIKATSTANITTFRNAVRSLSESNNLCNPHTSMEYSYSDPRTTISPVHRHHSSAWYIRRSGACLSDLAKFANITDFRPSNGFPQTQNITIDTIGFGVTNGDVRERFLKSVSEEFGGGTYYSASNQAALDNAFTSIAEDVSTAVNFAYNAPTIPVDVSDPTAVGSNIYLPLLEPSNKKIWPGNLNKYRYTLSVSTYTATVVNAGVTSSVTKQRERIVITGQGDQPALNSSGTLTANTRDLWATGGAGNDIKTGGIASLIHADTNRRIYTEDNAAATNLRLISALTPSAVNRANVYSSQINGNQLFCNYPSLCPKNGADRNTYQGWITDNNINTNIAINEINSSPYTSSRFREIALETFASVYPQTIRIHLANGVTGTPNSFRIQMDGSNYEDIRNVTPVNNIITIPLPDNNSAQNYELSNLWVSCDAAYTNCTNSRQLPIAEIEILEAPPSGGSPIVTDADWFTKVPLTTQQISDSVTKVGAPFHTRPIVVKTGSDNTVYLPTSEGVLHAFDATTGEELWGFMPTQLLPNIGVLRNNPKLGSADNPIYGLDGQPYYFKTADATPKHILVFGMRRGGHAYFALDVSNRNNPELLWKIDSSMPAFKKLGQTWPQAYPAPITIRGVEKSALVFGGGYDPLSDAKTSHTDASNNRIPDQVGNRIYFIDALTGDPLIVVTDTSNTTSTGENFGSAQRIQLSGLDFGIVANPAHLDYDQDKYYDRFYFADTGGQIIRLDISDALTGPALKASIMANLGGNGTAGFIRFFNPPTVAKQVLGGLDTASIVIGSGNRPKLAQKSTVDKLFVVRDQVPYSQIYTKTITLDNMYDVTSNVLQMSNDASVLTAQRTLLANADGWYLNLGDNITTAPYSGEKVINRARVYKGVIYFTTYTMLDQASSADVCAYVKSQSESRFYAIGLRDGVAVYPEFMDNGDGDSRPVTGDRFLKLRNPGGGIPSEITFYTVRGDTPDTVDLVLSAGLGPDGIKVPLRDTLVAKSWEVLPD